MGENSCPALAVAGAVKRAGLTLTKTKQGKVTVYHVAA
jgi:hypothetical protein